MLAEERKPAAYHAEGQQLSFRDRRSVLLTAQSARLPRIRMGFLVPTGGIGASPARTKSSTLQAMCLASNSTSEKLDERGNRCRNEAGSCERSEERAQTYTS